MSILKGVKNQISVKVTAVLMQNYEKVVKIPFIATFTKLETQESDALSRALGEVTNLEAGELLIAEVVNALVDWRDLPASDGGTVDFSEEALDEMLKSDGYRKALIDGFTLVQFNKRVSLQKN